MQIGEHVVTVQNNKITYIWVLNNCLILSFSMNSSHVKRKLHFKNDKDEIQEDSTVQLINSEKRKKGTLSISYVLHLKQQLSLICLTYSPLEEKDGNEVLEKNKETIPNDDL
jgi:hypothetical protein